MKVLMCTNGKKDAEETIDFGCNLLKGSKVDVTILYVNPGDDQDAKSCLKRAKKIVSGYGIPSKTKIRAGNPSLKIIQESKGYDLVITGYKELSSDLKYFKDIFISTTIENITKKITTSMLVVKSPKEINKVLICTDGSKNAERAIDFFGSLKLKAQVDVVNVIPEVYSRFKDILEPLAEEQLKTLTNLPGERTKHLHTAKKILGKYGLKADIRLLEGNFVEEIINLADYGLIVLGLRGIKEQKKETMGRNTRKVIRNVQIPVLAVK